MPPACCFVNCLRSKKINKIVITASNFAMNGPISASNGPQQVCVYAHWEGDSNAVNSIVDAAVKHWSDKPEFASKLSTFILFMEVSGAVGRADPRLHLLRRSQGTPLVHLPHQLA